jgi:serine protease Do
MPSIDCRPSGALTGLLMSFFAVLLTLPSTASLAAELDPEAAIMVTGRQLMPRIVRVHARDSTGRVNIGSGVPIGRDLVATNCHVTRRASSIELSIMTPYGPVPVPVTKQASAPNQDICLLRTAQILPMPPVGIGQTPGPGESVIAIGFTGGAHVQSHPGEVTALHAWDGAHVIQTTTAFDSGSSGGGLFTRDGRLVGLITFRSRVGDPRYFSAPARWIQTILATRSFEVIAPMPAGQAFWEQTGDELPDFLKAGMPQQSIASHLGWAAPH